MASAEIGVLEGRPFVVPSPQPSLIEDREFFDSLLAVAQPGSIPALANPSAMRSSTAESR